MTKITKIEISPARSEMVDLSIEGDHTFWVSQTGSEWFLTHNTSWPDIDSDCGDRDVLIDEARKIYGVDAVIPISNMNTLKLRSLVKDVSKYYGIPLEEVDAVTGPLQFEVEPHARGENTEKSLFILTHEDCMKYSQRYREFMEKYPQVMKHVENLFMQNKSVGRHAGGVLIADPDELASTMPLISVKGELQTPWTEGLSWRNLEDNGFIKFDFLGLTLLEDVRNCIRRILIEKGNRSPSFSDVRKFFDENVNCRFVDPSDRHVFENTYCSGRWAPGIFQFVNDGVRKLCVEAQPKSIEEVSAITAVYRPGPLKANVHRKYLAARKQAQEGTLRYPHPIIEEVLGSTFGFVVMQEQFMILAQKLGGFTPAESDGLRKTLVKNNIESDGKKVDEKKVAREKFISHARDSHGVSESVTVPLWETIEAMSKYCFNSSHSIAYSIDSYYAAWLYTYYPKHWLATILQSETGNPDGLTKTIAEIKQLGYQVGQADVNHSGLEWTFSDDLQAFVPPLTALKKVGDAAMREIMETRPFKDLNSLLFDSEGEWYHSKMNKGVFEALCKTESLGSLEEMKTGKIKHHRQLMEVILGNYDRLKKGRKGATKSQIKKEAKEGKVLPDIVQVLIDQTSDVEDWSREEKISFVEEITCTVSNDLLFPEDLLDRLMKKQVIPITELPGGQRAIAWMLVRNIQKKTTKNNKIYHVVLAQDHMNRQVKVKVWGDLKVEIKPFTVWLVEATGDDKWGPSTSAWKMRPLV